MLKKNKISLSAIAAGLALSGMLVSTFSHAAATDAASQMPDISQKKFSSVIGTIGELTRKR